MSTIMLQLCVYKAFLCIMLSGHNETEEKINKSNSRKDNFCCLEYWHFIFLHDFHDVTQHFYLHKAGNCHFYLIEQLLDHETASSLVYLVFLQCSCSWLKLWPQNILLSSYVSNDQWLITLLFTFTHIYTKLNWEVIFFICSRSFRGNFISF